MVLAENGHNSEQILLMKSILIQRKKRFGTNASGLNSESGLYFEWSTIRTFL